MVEMDVVGKLLNSISVEEADEIVEGMGLPKYIPAEEIERVAEEMKKIIPEQTYDLDSKDMLSSILSGMVFVTEEEIVEEHVSIAHEMAEDEEPEEDEEQTGEVIGIVHVDNGVWIEVVLTGNGLRYTFEDIRDEEAGELELYKSKSSVIGMAEERGYHVQPFSTQSAVKTLATSKIRHVLDISFDEAETILKV